MSPYGDEKSPFLAFILEFFLGFGIGNYYAGSIGWGLVGTVGSLALWGGTGLYTGAQNCIADYTCETNGPTMKNAGLGMMIGGLVFYAAAVIAAPVVASNYNERLREARARLYQRQSWKLRPTETWRWRTPERPRESSFTFAAAPQPVGVLVPVLRW